MQIIWKLKKLCLWSSSLGLYYIYCLVSLPIFLPDYILQTLIAYHNLSWSFYNPEVSNHSLFLPVQPTEKSLVNLSFFALSKSPIIWFSIYVLGKKFVLGKNCLCREILWTFGLCQVIFDFMEFLVISQWNSSLWHIHQFWKALRSNETWLWK